MSGPIDRSGPAGLGSRTAADPGQAAAPVSVTAADVRWGADGLAPAIVVDAGDGAVLMLGWMDAEALAATRSSGDVHFHSRSRGRLWRKGETSGNLLRVRSLALDCDGDAILVRAAALGPTCHRGTRSCFDAEADTLAAGVAVPRPVLDREPAPGPGPALDPERVAEPRPVPAPGLEGFAWLEALWSTIRSRAAERPTGSYTASLLAGGVDAVGRKVTEEATEVLIAAKDDATAAKDDTTAASGERERTRAALAEESADLLYHAMVLLAERDLRPADVLAVLRARHPG